MTDQRIRDLERQAALGDAEALEAVKAHRCRVGDCCAHVSVLQDEVAKLRLRTVVEMKQSTIDPWYDNYNNWSYYGDSDDYDEYIAEHTTPGSITLTIQGDDDQLNALMEKIFIPQFNAHHPDPMRHTCAYCHQPPGAKCVTKAGSWAKEHHVARGFYRYRAPQYSAW